MKIETLEQLNAEILAGRIEHLFMLSESYQDMMIAKITNGIIESGKRIVMIAGPSSSGKTTTAKKVSLNLEAMGIDTLCLGTDDYFVDRKLLPFNEDGEQDFECLEAVDLKLFDSQLMQLLAGEGVCLPKYDFYSGEKRFDQIKHRLNKDQLIIIEGIHALNDALTPHLERNEKFRVYVEPKSSADPSVNPTDVRKLRRVIRDNLKHGWSAKDTLMRWSSVIDGEVHNIFPFKDDVDISFDTSYVYEPAVLKNMQLRCLRRFRRATLVMKRLKGYLLCLISMSA